MQIHFSYWFDNKRNCIWCKINNINNSIPIGLNFKISYIFIVYIYIYIFVNILPRKYINRFMIPFKWNGILLTILLSVCNWTELISFGSKAKESEWQYLKGNVDILLRSLFIIIYLMNKNYLYLFYISCSLRSQTGKIWAIRRITREVWGPLKSLGQL